MKAAIFFGTFNPIHKGHINISESVRELYGLDKVFIIPSKISPHKNDLDIEDSDHRLKMCQLACENIAKVEVCDLEINSDVAITKIDVIDKLIAEYHLIEIVYIMGSDVFISLPRWQELDEIINKTTICVIPRNKKALIESLKIKERLAVKGGLVHITDLKFINISSTEIREKIVNKASVEGLLADKVLTYILKNRLYNK